MAPVTSWPFVINECFMDSMSGVHVDGDDVVMGISHIAANRKYKVFLLHLQLLYLYFTLLLFEQSLEPALSCPTSSLACSVLPCIFTQNHKSNILHRQHVT
jgi:hypothetical protein